MNYLFEQLELFLHQRKVKPHRLHLLTEKQIDSMQCISVISVIFDVNLHLIVHLLTDAFRMLTTCIHIYQSYISYMFFMIIETKLIII